MEWRLPFTIFLPLVGATVALGTALYAGRRRKTPGAPALVIAELAVALWLLAFVATLANPEIQVKVFLVKIQLLGMIIWPASMFMFVVQFTGHRDWVAGALGWLISAVPVVAFLIIWSNDLHLLYYQNVAVSFGIQDPDLILVPGPLFWLQKACAYALLFAASIMLVHGTTSDSPLFRRQATVFLVSIAVPFVGDIAFQLGFNPLPVRDPFPLYFTATIFIIAWGLLRYRVLELAPTAREAIFTNLQDGVIVMDVQQRVVELNPAARKVTGYSSDSAIGKSICAILPEISHRLTCPTPSDEIDIEFVIERAGKELWYDLNMAPLVDRSAGITGYMAVLHDTTEHKEAQRVLQRSKEAAEQATATKSEFVATISHEIRTPMNAVIGMTALLLNTNLSDEQLEYVETINTSGNSMLGIVNNVLDLSRIEAGQLELESRPFALGVLIEEVLELFGVQAAAKRNELAFSIGEGVPRQLVGDIIRVRQVLTNLVSNAMKFTEKGDIAILVDHQMAGGNCLLHFSVRDTGVGIPLDRTHRLFRSFSQADTSTARRFGGSGLGLAISKRLCELMGGTISVESEPGVGSIFHFTVSVGLPVDQSAGEPTDARLIDMKALVVDDSEICRKSLASELEYWGMCVSVAKSAREALYYLESSNNYDLALFDLNMPGTDGEALLSEVRRTESGRSLPVIMMAPLGAPSLRSGHSLRARLEHLNMSALLTKPIRMSQVYRAVCDTFGERPNTSRPRLQSAMDVGLAQRVPLQILLTEDNTLSQKVTLRLLRNLGYHADLAVDGKQALTMLNRRAYDVILMDVHMPEMDGLEATRQIRAQNGGSYQPYIIALTASQLEHDREVCLSAGMNDYIAKPLSVTTLIESLEIAGQRDETQTIVH